MTDGSRLDLLDLLIIGAGPTGIAIGADAVRAGLSTLLVERGSLTQNLLDFPTFMTFFTTRDLLEIADIPFSVPDEKPDRRQALAYYRGVARRYALPLALHEEVEGVRREPDGFAVTTRGDNGVMHRRAGAVAFATGYFGQPKHLDVEGEDLPWVQARYLDAYRHFGERVVVVGGGNSAAEAALDLWRTGAQVTLVHRGAAVKETVKYWVKPDIENRIAEGTIAARFSTRVVRFSPAGVEIDGPAGRETLPAAAAYVLIGYLPDTGLLARSGVRLDPATLVPEVNPDTCESNVPGLYLAGTLLAGRDTGKIFIENSRDHGGRIVRHLLAGKAAVAPAGRE